MQVRKAVIAVAGFGTRFLPATKVLAKEMMPIVDKPVVQYLVEEVVAAGIREIIFVTRSGTQAIADHFDSSRDLEVELAAQGKHDYLKMIEDLPKLANFAFVRQARHLPYGNGTPILAAKGWLDRDEPFVYMFGDDLVLSETSCVKQLVDLYEEHQPGGVVAVQEVPREETSKYGIVKIKAGSNPAEMESIVEKPRPEEAPSNLAQFGRFVLSGRIIDILENSATGQGGELWLADAVDRLRKESRVLVHAIEGTWYTTGDPLNFLKTTIQYALRHKEIGPAVANYLRELPLKGVEG